LERHKTIPESEMALFFRVHAVVCLKKCLTPPTLLEMAILRQSRYETKQEPAIATLIGPVLRQQRERVVATDFLEICR
jgi:hypothetical protein